MAFPLNLPATANIRGWWKLDEASGNAVDSSGNSNTLTETSGTIAAATGKIGGGRDFEAGDTEYFTIADASQTGLDITGEITICAWIKLESTAGTLGTFCGIAGKYNAAAGKRCYLLTLSNADNKLKVYLSADGTATTTASSSTALSSTGTWYHVAFTLNQTTDKIQTYINGSADGTAADYTSNIKDADTAFALGTYFSSGSPSSYLDGIIDEVIVWNTCLTSTQITAVYNITSYQYNIAAAITPAGSIGSTAKVTKRSAAAITASSVIGSATRVIRKLAGAINPAAVIGSAAKVRKPIASVVTGAATVGSTSRVRRRILSAVETANTVTSFARLNKRSYSDILAGLTVTSASRVGRVVQAAVNGLIAVGSFIRINLSFASEVIANSTITSAIKIQRRIDSSILGQSVIGSALTNNIGAASNTVSNSIVSASARALYSFKAAVITVANVSALLRLLEGEVTTGTFYLWNNTLIAKTGADVGTYHIIDNMTEIRVGGTYIKTYPFTYPYFQSCTDGIVTLNLQIAA